MFNIIVAVDENFGIGKCNSLPWNCSNDLKHFASTTAHSVLIFGHNTWYNLSETIQSKMLKNRHVIVITRNTIGHAKVHAVTSLNHALLLSKQVYESKTIYVCGGAKVYHEALKHKDLHSLIVTLIKGTYDCDIYVPNLKKVMDKLSATTEIFHNDCSIYIYS